jgi:hypothetical protein
MSNIGVSPAVNDSSPDTAGRAAGPGHRTAPTAVQLLLPVWGYDYIREFLQFGLPTLLAPGNIPAIAQALPCTFVILTSREDAPYINEHPAFRHLSTICTTEIRLIDHLITGSNYSTTVTLAYTEAVRAAGAKMLDTCFFFLVSDYIMADGSLRNVFDRMKNGSSGVLVGNFQVALEDALPWLREQLDMAGTSLALEPRELMRWALNHLHPATVANTVNFPLNHNEHTNRLFWRVDGNTLIGRFFLMHMLCVRPEIKDFVVGSSCDYSFIPEMCPSNDITVINDSDEYLVIEMQPWNHESKFLRPGPLKPHVLANTLAEWTTARHRENSQYSVVFHSEEVPAKVSDTIGEADSFLASVNRTIKKKPKPHRGHPYWGGAMAAFKDATGERLTQEEWRMVLGLQDPAISDRWINDWLVDKIRLALFKRPPYVRLWHHRWADYRPILRRLETWIENPSQRLLLISDTPTVFTASFADGGERAVRLLRRGFLTKPAESYSSLKGQFDVCLAELSEEELKQVDELIDRIAPLMKVGGEILVAVQNRRGSDAERFGASVGFHAARLMRPSSSLAEVLFVPASRLRLTIMRTIFRLGHIARGKPWVGIPLLLTAGPVVAVCSAVANLATGGKTKSSLRARQCATSFLMMLRVNPNDATQAYKYSPRRLMRQGRGRRAGIVDGVAQAETSPVPSTVEHPRPPGLGTSASVNINTTHPEPRRDERTRERQYQDCLEVRDRIGLTPLGVMTNQVWYDDPRRLGILLSRYKFVAKMLSGRCDVGEVGCGDAFGSRVVLQSVAKLTVYDFEPIFIEDIRQRYCERWPIKARQHDIILGTLPQQHDGIYSLDVMEHIPPRDEHAYLSNLRGSLTENGVLIIGMPSLESQPYTSSQSREGHVNCKRGAELKLLLERYFQNVFLFSMNDEVVHTGFYPMAHYLLAICCGKK